MSPVLQSKFSAIQVPWASKAVSIHPFFRRWHQYISCWTLSARIKSPLAQLHIKTVKIRGLPGPFATALRRVFTEAASVVALHLLLFG